MPRNAPAKKPSTGAKATPDKGARGKKKPAAPEKVGPPRKNKKKEKPAGTSEDQDEDFPPLREPPKMPPGAAAVNIENRLHVLQPGQQLDWIRPWFFFDQVDPVAKFRDLGPHIYSITTPDVPEGRGPILDEPGDTTVPVEVPGYA